MVKKKKGVDINIKVDGADELIKEGKRWKKEKGCWNHTGMGIWGFGSALAMVLSYVQNSSILWAILHGIISWIYVIYRIFTDYNIFN
jgi:hypothetical protein